MVAIVKAAIMKGIIGRRKSWANQIGMEEDTIEEEVADRIISTSSATNFTNRVTMQTISTLTNVIIVVKWGILQKNVESI